MLGAAAAAALLLKANPAAAAYGDSANVFGKATNTSGFVAYAGEGFSLLLPTKWNPSKERDFPGATVSRGAGEKELSLHCTGMEGYREPARGAPSDPSSSPLVLPPLPPPLSSGTRTTLTPSTTWS